MTDSEAVSAQITDSVTQANVAVLGNGPAYSLAQSQLAMAQSQSVLFANMVNGYQQNSIASGAATMQSVMQLLQKEGGRSTNDAAEAVNNLSSLLNTALGSIGQKLATT